MPAGGIPRVWTEKEIQTFKKNFGKITDRQLAKKLKCGVGSVPMLAKKLGMERNIEEPGDLVGRPTKYKKKFCEQVKELGKQGLSKVQMGSKMGVSADAIIAWANPKSQNYHPEFHKALKESLEFSMAWWEDTLMDHLSDVRGKGGEGRHTNSALIVWAMSNKFNKHYRRDPDKAEESDDKAKDHNINITINGKSVKDNDPS